MTIHGALAIDFGRMFEPGQAYTALSRTTALANVEIRNFNHMNRGMRANRAVLAFYEKFFPQATNLLALSSDAEVRACGKDAAVS